MGDDTIKPDDKPRGDGAMPSALPCSLPSSFTLNPERILCASAAALAVLAHGRVAFANPAMHAVCGYPLGSLLSLALPELVHPDDLSAFTDAYLGCVTGQAPSSTCEIRLLGPASDPHWTSLRFSLLHNPQGPLVCVWACDISDRRRLEDRALQAHKMESVGRLAAGVAHDFSNLLTVITSSIDMALLELSAEHSARVDLLEARRAARRASNLTQQLLAFSRRQNLQPRVVDFSSLVGEMTGLLRRIIGDDIELLFSPCVAPLSVRVDPSQMEHVLANLTANARDALAGRGTLAIACSKVSLTELPSEDFPDAPAGDYALLTVRDTGCGMSSEVKSCLFEPFFTTKEAGTGSGLGLATCYGVVRQNNGHIAVESSPGNGSVFRILLPLVEGAIEEAPLTPRQHPAASRGNETILVVEDEAQVRSLAARILRSRGYRVLEAESGVDALALADKQAPGSIDLLLADVVMPRISGEELALTLRQTNPAIRVVFMSGCSEARLAESFPNDSHGFVQKPFSPAHLLAEIRRLLEKPL